MISAATAPGLGHTVINVGSGSETSIRELVRIMLENTGLKTEAIYNPRTSPGVSRMCADLSLAREKLGYNPVFSLADGLRLTMERDKRFSRRKSASE